MKTARLELTRQLTPEQAAALVAAASAPVPTDAPGVESGASYAPSRGGAVPLSVVRPQRRRGAAKAHPFLMSCSTAIYLDS